jgi:hypothetical protein
MILHFKGFVGTSVADQDALFALIKVNTHGNRPRGQINDHDCPSFPTQECTRCPGVVPFTCWCTYPPALEDTLKQRIPAVLLTTHANDEAASTQVLRSVDWNLPPAVLVKNGLHWLAVAGYLPGAADGDGMLIDGRRITDIYVRDPTVGAANHVVGIKVWMREYLAPVIQCGIFQNLLVVIAATAQTETGSGPSRRTKRLRKGKRRGRG